MSGTYRVPKSSLCSCLCCTLSGLQSCHIAWHWPAISTGKTLAPELMLVSALVLLQIPDSCSFQNRFFVPLLSCTWMPSYKECGVQTICEARLHRYPSEVLEGFVDDSETATRLPTLFGLGMFATVHFLAPVKTYSTRVWRAFTLNCFSRWVLPEGPGVRRSLT